MVWLQTLTRAGILVRRSRFCGILRSSETDQQIDPNKQPVQFRGCPLFKTFIIEAVKLKIFLLPEHVVYSKKIIVCYMYF